MRRLLWPEGPLWIAWIEGTEGYPGNTRYSTASKDIKRKQSLPVIFCTKIHHQSYKLKLDDINANFGTTSTKSTLKNYEVQVVS